MRKTLFQKTLKYAEQNKQTYLLTGDVGYSFVEEFAQQFPERFINAGIAEQNMVGMAAGIALAGGYPVIYSIATFLIMRCYEQIRDDLAYQNLPSLLVGTGAGLSYGGYGATHHALEDLALMSALPNMTVLAPGDVRELEMLLDDHDEWVAGPGYLRISKVGGVIKDLPDVQMSFGKITHYLTGGEILLLSVGTALELTKELCSLLTKKGYRVGLAQIHTVVPLDIQFLTEVAAKYRAVFVVEDHFKTGGVGQQVAEVFMSCSVRPELFETYGYEKRFISCGGDMEFLRNCYGMSAEKLAARINARLEQGLASPLFAPLAQEIKGIQS